MKAIVTGASGFVGSHLVDLLLKQGHEVTAVDVAEGEWLSDASSNESYAFSAGDVRDGDFIGRTVSKGADVVFHLAAIVGVSNYLKSPFDVVDVNVIGTKNVLEAASRSGTRVVVASTSEVFGKNPDIPWKEDADRVLGSTNVDRWSYSTSKAAAEHLAFAVHRQMGLPVSIVRYFNAYGPRQVPNYVISRAVHRTLNGRPPVVYDGGTQTRCFTFIGDVVGGTLAAGTDDRAIGEAFNLGSQVETTVMEATLAILEEAEMDLEIEHFSTEENLGERYQDIIRRVPDSSKAGRLLDWQPTVDLREGVRRTIDWARSHPDWLALPDPIDASEPTTTDSGD